MAKPESELYERERGQTKKSKLAPSRRAPTSDQYLHQDLVFVPSFAPDSSLGGALWWRLAGPRKGEVLGGDSWNNHSTNLSLVSCILELSGLFLVQGERILLSAIFPLYSFFPFSSFCI